MPGAESFCELSFPLPAASGCLRAERNPSAPPATRHIGHMQAPVLIASAFRSCLQMSLKRNWGSPSQRLSSCQISVAKVLEDMTVLHVGNMAQPDFRSQGNLKGRSQTKGPERRDVSHQVVFHSVTSRLGNCENSAKYIFSRVSGRLACPSIRSR